VTEHVHNTKLTADVLNAAGAKSAADFKDAVYMSSSMEKVEVASSAGSIVSSSRPVRRMQNANKKPFPRVPGTSTPVERQNARKSG